MSDDETTDVQTLTDSTEPDAGGEDAGATGTGEPEAGSPETAPQGEELLVREGDIAADYLERFLDIGDFGGDIDLDVENDRALVAVLGDHKELRPLVGQRGATLDALQELTRLAVQQQTGVRSRLMLDIASYRADRRDELSTLAKRTAESALADGEDQRLTAMNAFERKVVHDAIAEIDGVHSESEGEEPNRRVIVSTD